MSANAPDSLIEEYRLAAREHDIVIAEVGAWTHNPMSQDREKAEYREFMEKQESTGTTLGDRFGALLASVQTADESEESEDKDQETAGPSDEQ